MRVMDHLLMFCLQLLCCSNFRTLGCCFLCSSFCFICLFFPLIIFSLFVFPFYLFLLDLMCLLFNISILIVLLSMLCFQWETKYKKLLQVTLLGDGFVASTLVSCLLNSLLSFVSPLGCIIALPTCPIPFLFRLTDLLLPFYWYVQPPSVSVASDLCSRLLPE
jgi:hypothetical protein